MAKREITQLIDDLDGTILEDGKGETIRFSLKGRSYDIDLSETNAAKLSEALAPFIAVARPVSTVAKSERSRTARGTSRATELTAIREWANRNGHTVSSRGRVPQSVVEAYEASR